MENITTESDKEYFQNWFLRKLGESYPKQINPSENLDQYKIISETFTPKGVKITLSKAPVNQKDTNNVKRKTLTVIFNIFNVKKEDSQLFVEELNKNAIYLSFFLNDSLPPHITTLFDKYLFKNIVTPIDITFDKKVKEDTREDVTNLCFQRLIKKVKGSVKELFLFMDTSYNDVLEELKLKRASHIGEVLSTIKPAKSQAMLAGEVVSVKSYNKFWSFNPESLSLNYRFTADELPAATYKKFDPLPLLGLEDEADLVIQETYAQVANRSQAYSMSLKAEDSSEEEEAQ